MLSGFLKSASKYPNNTAIIINSNAFSYQWVLNKAIVIAKDESHLNQAGVEVFNKLLVKQLEKDRIFSFNEQN